MGITITPEWLKVASRYNPRLLLSIITFVSWLGSQIGLWWKERAICVDSSRLGHLRRWKLVIHQRANTDMCPYNGISGGFLGIWWRCYLVAANLQIHGATGGWTIWALSGDQNPHVFKAQRGSFDVSYPHVGMDVISLSDSPNWVWQVNDSLRERIRTHGGSHSGDTGSRRNRVDLQRIRLWLCNPRVSGRGGSRPGRPSGIPPGCSWITVRVEVGSEGGGGVADILILRAISFHDLLASEVVVWTFFLRVGVRIGQLAVTVVSISSDEIGTRNWTCEQRAVAAVAAAECTNNKDHEWRLAAHRDTKWVEDIRAWLFHSWTILNPDSSIFVPTAPQNWRIEN